MRILRSDIYENLKMALATLRGNKLRRLPASIAELPNLEKLDLRWNKLSGDDKWIQNLERRGCRVLR